MALSRHLYDLNKSLGNNALMLAIESVALGDAFWLDVAAFESTLAAHLHHHSG